MHIVHRIRASSQNHSIITYNLLRRGNFPFQYFITFPFVALLIKDSGKKTIKINFGCGFISFSHRQAEIDNCYVSVLLRSTRFLFILVQSLTNKLFQVNWRLAETVFDKFFSLTYYLKIIIWNFANNYHFIFRYNDWIFTDQFK